MELTLPPLSHDGDFTTYLSAVRMLRSRDTPFPVIPLKPEMESFGAVERVRKRRGQRIDVWSAMLREKRARRARSLLIPRRYCYVPNPLHSPFQEYIERNIS
jgi:hypothetical protein